MFKIFDNVQVSLEGPKEVNDLIRGRGVYDKVLKNIKMLVESGVTVLVNITVNTLNVSVLESFIKYLLSNGIHVGLQFLTPTRSPLKNYAVNPSLLACTMSLAIKYNIKIDDPRRIVFDKKLQKWVMSISRKKYGIVAGCTAGIAALTITPELDVLPCSRLRIKLGNLKEHSLVEIWVNNRLLKALRDRRNLKGKCRKCIWRDACGGCRADAFYVYGDVLAEDPFCPMGTTIVAGDCK